MSERHGSDRTESGAPEPASHRVPDGDRPRLDLDKPFLRGALREAGIADFTLRQPAFTRVLPGVWVCTRSIDHDTDIRAALLVHPGSAYASFLSAAEVLGLPVPDHAFRHVTVTRHRDRRFRPGIKPHVTQRRQRVIVVRGVRTTDPIETFIDCAGWLGVVDLVVLGDAIVKTYGIPAAGLVAACRASNDYYRAAALAAARLVRDGVDSPMETRLRLLIVLAGLPEPEVNHVLRHENGEWRRRFDLFYAAARLVIEYDGRQHAESSRQWRRDLKRREELDDDGYRMLVFTAEDIYQHPRRTLEKIRQLLVERGMVDVPHISEEWEKHFAA